MTNFKGQTKRPNKTKNERGITLVALIITIIILIILAAVTINALTHDGLADLAIKSTQDYQKAQSDEMNMLNEIDNMVKETLKNIEDGTVTPSSPEAPAIESVTLEVQDNPNGSKATVIATVQPENAGVVSYKFEYKLGSESDYKLCKEISSSDNSCTYTYTDLSQEVINNLKVTATDYKGNSKEATLDVTPDAKDPMNPNIDTTYGGLTVDYTPKAGQVYNTEGKLSTTASGSDEYSGYGFQYFQTSDLPSGWQVWGTDDEYIYIISSRNSTLSLCLRNYSGYNNGVTLLDNICDNVYTDKTTYPGSVAQNLKLEQVLAVTSDSASDNMANQYNTAPYSYNFAYPYIWSEYEQLQNNSINNRSKAYTYVNPEPSFGTIASATKSPYATLWNRNYMHSENAWINLEYLDILMYSGQLRECWLSSRFVWPKDEGVCDFGLQSIRADGTTSAGISAYIVYGYGDGEAFSKARACALRPIVSFPTAMYDLDTSQTPAKIVPKS